MQAALRASIVPFVARLERACGAIQGSRDIDDSMHEAMHHAETMLVRVLSDPNATQGTLEEECAEFAAAHSARELAAHRAAAEESCEALSVLLQSAVAFRRPVDIAAFLEAGKGGLQAMLQSPPRAFEEQMCIMGLAQAVLRAVMVHCGRDVAHAAVILHQYLCTGSNANRLATACTRAVAAIRSDLDAPDSSERWHRVRVSNSHTPQPDVEVEVQPPQHATRGSRLVLACTEGTAPALPVVRFAKALQLCARNGVVSVGSMRPHFFAKHRYSKAEDHWTAPCSARVPVDLQRDFHLLCALEAMLPRGCASLGAHEASQHASLANHFLASNFGSKSVAQSMNYVFRRCAAAIGHGVDYVHSEDAARRTGRLELTEEGCARLRVFIRSTACCVSQGGERARAAWRPSRSSKAAAAAAKRGEQTEELGRGAL